MRRLDTPAERLWFVIVTAPLILGAIPLTLALGTVVGDLPVGQLGFRTVLLCAFLVTAGLAGGLGIVTARRIHQVVTPDSRIGRAADVDRTIGRATTVVFGVYVFGMILLTASIVFPTVDLDSTLGLLLIPFSPVFLLPTLRLPSSGALVVFVLVGATTGLWHVFLGVVVGRIFERVNVL